MDWIVLLPPVVAIGLAMWTRQIYLSLFAGLWLGTTILAGGNPVLGLRELADQIVTVFTTESNARILVFCLLVGGLVALVQASGGVQGFIKWARARGWGESRRGAELLAWGIGVVLFVESNISSLTVGAVSRPLFDRLSLPREKLAYYCDATCAPVCMSIPLNGWGAFVLGLVGAQELSQNAVAVLAEAVLFNFFALFAIGFSLVLALTGWGFGAMRRAEKRAADTGQVLRPDAQPMIEDDVARIEPPDHVTPQARNLLLPVAVMVAMIFVGLYVTGGGNLMEGSGSTAVLWAVGTALGAALLLYAIPRPLREGRATLTLGTSMDWVVKGASGLVPVTLLLVLAFALGQVSQALEMGDYVVQLVGEQGPAWWMPVLVFAVTSFVAFTLGSSWTAFAILIPVVMPLAVEVALPSSLMLGAVLSGGIFGDHTSPLSDTSIISSMAAASDHVDHVNTQMPYALVQAGLAAVAFVVAGLLAG
ncbi:Na+/H+ antiporter NhaC [Salinibacter ruber]|jgi:Na+/H+ antiporter NhaC|uniref:Na+/H+ antiporter NhaC n=1 Tax=Salinibacter ruber TaxID=146919 RepID=A0A9X2TTB5_9BACT|nr:Na+/H+ antiporter NhaC family protein [Salinibacter ruber]MCS3627668.1 Na+/H+ antiporter NhaC [Salinibacter ruber]MCS3630105.1 Na+/H+ antiporter NhaC [Salinibacter ruber]MCS3640426.1 Na+/H+ antiporter NhaC [Salinibacter ruber]MCS3642610.1 Na+/H+ antiporter NhaC [Salinibacter ruber]MCS3656080.1 Na+/H+ antiporter NhaC [Salinibacter ruber]